MPVTTRAPRACAPSRRARTALRPRRSTGPAGPTRASAARVGAHDVNVLLEVGDAQRAREPRGAAGRQHVVGAGDVVADAPRARTARRTPRPRCARAARADRPSAHMSSRCSGAIAFAASSARAASSTTITRPPASSVDTASSRRGRGDAAALRARDRRGRRPLRPRRSAATAPPGPCSACARRSAATHAGSTVSSATIATSDAPASPSMPTVPNTWRFASATYALPGPTITSTGRSVPAPNAIAAIACAPPTRYTSSTSAIAAAARIASWTCAVGSGRRAQHDLGDAGDARRERRHQHRRRLAARGRRARNNRRGRPGTTCSCTSTPRRSWLRLPFSRCASCHATIWSRASSSAARSSGRDALERGARSRPRSTRGSVELDAVEPRR